MTVALMLAFTVVSVSGQRRGGGWSPDAAEPDAPAKKSVSVSVGVYTSAQAERGRAAYLAQCASCHREDLTGKGFAPGLVGAEFVSRWDGQAVRDFYSRIRTTMPEDLPGSLSPEDTIDIVAYLFQVNELPPGNEELEREALEEIMITDGKEAGP